jgi:hypothetical protein
MAEKLPCPTPSWSDIPLELAGLVLRLLPAYADRACFASVCPQWRAAAQQIMVPPPVPLLALPDGTFYSLPCTEPFRFAGCGFAGFKSACGSMLVFPRDDGCFLVNPFSRATVALPALSSVRLYPPDADVSHVSVDPPRMTWLHIKDKNPQLSKIMLCSMNLAVAFVNHQGFGQILVCQPGASSWSVRAYDTCKGFEDMGFYQGKLYILSHHEHLSVLDISQDQTTGDPHISRIVRVIKGNPFPLWPTEKDTRVDKKLYLVESCGALLMVRRKVFSRRILDKYVFERNKFEVFQADLKQPAWVDKTTIGDDQVLFLGRRCSQIVPVSQYGLLGDRIWFLDDDEEYFNGCSYEDESASVGVYDVIGQVFSFPLPTVSWKRDGMRLATWLLPQN